MKRYICSICKSLSVKKILDFGEQPISNRFLRAAEEKEFKHSFCLGYCQFCGLAQLINPPPSEELKPLFEWISYREPEGHLDLLTEILSNLPGITPESSFCGLGIYEESTLERLRKKGFSQVWSIKLDQTQNSCCSLTMIDAIQEFLTHKDIKKITNNRGHPQVIIARDVLEHAHEPLQFLRALREMVRPDGYVVFEVPDYSKTFALCDYSSLWEEHISYFTPYTFVKCLEISGFEVHTMNVFSYDTQDYLVAIVRPKKNGYQVKSEITSNMLKVEEDRIHHYGLSYFERRSWYKSVLSAYHQRGKIALLGAGHLACHFINFHCLDNLIDFLVDDHPYKSSMFMPGSRLPILSTSALMERNVNLCLLSVSPENERKVIESKKEFIASGGQFASIFPTSKHPLTALN